MGWGSALWLAKREPFQSSVPMGARSADECPGGGRDGHWDVMLSPYGSDSQTAGPRVLPSFIVHSLDRCLPGTESMRAAVSQAPGKGARDPLASLIAEVLGQPPRAQG